MMWADLGILQMRRAEPLITEFYQGGASKESITIIKPRENIKSRLQEDINQTKEANCPNVLLLFFCVLMDIIRNILRD